jgi:signal transduction histidine kinase
VRLNVLLVEDSEEDTKMILYELKREGYDVVSARVETAADLQTILFQQDWNVIISDYFMPEFDALSALQLVQQNSLDIPFIIVSGSVGEDIAVEAMKAGAHDYLMKDKLSRLVPAIERELREAIIRRERREAELAVQRAYEELERRVQERTVELARTNELLKQALRARDEFISVAAHELKTPVTSMRGFAQTLLRQVTKNGDVDPVKLQRSLNAISQQSEKLTLFISQLLDVSRLEAGRLTLDPQPTDILELVENVAEVIQMGTTTHVIKVTSDAAITAYVDPLRLEQVISNLLNNAVKFSPSGGTVTIDITRAEADTLCIAVTDEGIGIPVEHRGHIFERFYQADKTGRAGGMGIGLFISSQIIELHGGQIAVEFPSEGGTRFRVTLPVNRQANAEK